MKKTISISLIFVIIALLNTTTLYGGWSKGSCSFKGSTPSHSFSYGSLVIYHNGTVKKTGTSGSKNVWSGSGDICVIYRKKSDIGKQIFKTNGNVQQCFKYAR